MPRPSVQERHSPVVLGQCGLTLLAASEVVWRLAQDPTAGTSVGVTLAAACAAAAALLTGRRRLASVALAAALLSTIVLSPEGPVAPVALSAALGLSLAARPGTASAAAQSGRGGRSVAAGIGVSLMAPVGLLYLLSFLVAPVPAVYAILVMYAALLGATVLLAQRRSWWVLAVPAAASVLWLLTVEVGSRYWGWAA